MPFIKCRFCDKQFSDKLTICPFCKRDAALDSTSHARRDTSSDTHKTMAPEPGRESVIASSSRRYISPIIVVSVIVALGTSLLGYRFYQGVEKRNASREFAALVGSVSGKLITLGANSQDVVDEINKEWREAIFSEDRKRDFNDAILEVRTKRSSDISSLKRLSEEISTDIKNMNPAEGKEQDYQRLKELYLLFNRYADMAISPSGSLQTYSEQNSKLTVEIKSAIKELELLK